ncbi:MAG: thioredoxin-disulfide reductase [Treponema sp.]|jgi:thioredoxin reductase (NADPH)|nr:thioredoxin-disulfide reductase [Treponema sp.]
MPDYDLVVIGAGPAGLTAAQYGARAALKVLVIEQLSVGGQVLLIDVLENYPGNTGQKSGFDFIMDLHNQAENFGASFLFNKVSSIEKKADCFRIVMVDGSTLTAAALIIATGAKPRLLGIPGEKEFTGKGVSYCATCDGNFFKEKKIFVIGGGDAACDEARYLSRLSSKVVLVHRKENLRAQKVLTKRTLENPNIQVRFNTVIKEIKGALAAQKVGMVVLENLAGSQVYEEQADAVFISVGTVPLSELAAIDGVEKCVELDNDGYIITNSKMETNIPGVFAAGDVRAGAFRQVVTAAGDGAIAAFNAAKYIGE